MGSRSSSTWRAGTLPGNPTTSSGINLRMSCFVLWRKLVLCAMFLLLFTPLRASESLQLQANALLSSTEKTSILAPGGESLAFHESVAFTLRGMTSADVQGTLMRDYASKERWRWRLDLPQYAEMEVCDGKRIGEQSSSEFEPVRVQQLRVALPPKVVRLNRDDVVKKISRANLHGTEVRCIDFENIHGRERAVGELCVDPVRGTLMRWRHGELERQWFDFVPFRGGLYPRHLVVLERGREVIEADVEFREESDMAPTMFQIPDGMSTRNVCQRVLPPVLIGGEDPKYPSGLRSRPTGTVVVQAKIGTDGRVRADSVLQTVDSELDRAAEEAVKQWVFEPAKCDGEPMEERVSVQVNFKGR